MAGSGEDGLCAGSLPDGGSTMRGRAATASWRKTGANPLPTVSMPETRMKFGLVGIGSEQLGNAGLSPSAPVERFLPFLADRDGETGARPRPGTGCMKFFTVKCGF